MATVLIVDDEVNIAQFLRDFLEQNGFNSFVTHTAHEGLTLALEKDPDMILLDVDLPDLNGYELCRLMRQKTSLRNKPILMLSALSEQKDELAGLKAGADDYMTKPINTTRLLARLNTALHRNIRELDANPLTHLPGNTSIYQEIDKDLRNQIPFSVVYADLNNFKSFNDRYGFVRGDQAIKLAAQCLESAVEAHGKEGLGFLGHIGGDDFVAIVSIEKVEALCKDVISRFDNLMPNLYDESDRKRGFIEGQTRQGQPVRYPLLSIALVAVSSLDQSFAHPGEISSLATEMKGWAKSFGRSAYVINRRKQTREG